MPLELDQEIVRKNEANFKLLDDRNITGGLHTVVNVAARNSILSSLRKAGMLCWVQSPPTMYQLANDLTSWTIFSGGSGAVVAVTGNDPIWVDNTDPANPIIGPVASATVGAVIISDGTLFSQRRITYDDIDPAFSITAFAAGFGTTKELGDTIINPGFTAAYNAAVVSATLDETETPGPISLLTPFAAFAYGTPPLPARSYVKAVINATVTWTLAATKAPSGPVKLSSIAAVWRARRFFGLSVLPGAYDEAFIEGLASSGLAGGFSGVYALGSGGGTQRIYLCWPTAFGNPASIKDQGGFVFPMTKVATAVPVTNAFSVLVPGGYDVWESGITVVPFTLTVT